MIPAKHGPGRYVYVITGVLTAVVLGAWGIKLMVGDSPFNATRASSAPVFQTATPAPGTSAGNGYPNGTDPGATTDAGPNAYPVPDPGGVSASAAPSALPGDVVPPNPDKTTPSNTIPGGNGRSSEPHHW